MNSLKFFVEPPYYMTNVPRFLLKRHIVSFFRKLLAWSTMEYFSAINFYREHGNDRAAKMIEKYHTPISVLSKYPKFKDLCQSLVTDETIWNMFSPQERLALTNAYRT